MHLLGYFVLLQLLLQLQMHAGNKIASRDEDKRLITKGEWTRKEKRRWNLYALLLYHIGKE